jgi:hypothetical protein
MVSTAVSPVVDSEAIKRVKVLTERVQKRKREWEKAIPIICPESSISFTQSWKETEGLPLDLKWAKAFARMLQDSAPVIREGELIVGSVTKHVRGIDMVAALRPLQVLEQLKEKRFDRIMSETSWGIIEKDDERILREDAQYWAEHMPPNYINAALREEMGEEYFDLVMDGAMVFEGQMLRLNQERGLFQDFGGSEVGMPAPRALVIIVGL